MMRALYEKPQVEEILLTAWDAIALSVDDDDDGFAGGVPFGLRDNFNVFEDE